jgi:hypothetical protein
VLSTLLVLHFWLPLCVVCPSCIYTSDYPFVLSALLVFTASDYHKEVIRSVNTRRVDNTKR